MAVQNMQSTYNRKWNQGNVMSKLSEKITDGKTCLYLLDLQRVRMLPEIAGVKSAIFMQRI